MKFLIKYLIIVLFFNNSLLFSQDTLISNNKVLSNYSFKISSLILAGELPLIIEYNPNKKIGHEFSIALPVYNIKPNSKQFIGIGYKIRYGFRYYIKLKKRNDKMWFINPQIFFKKFWINDRYYNSDYFIFGSGGSDTFDSYYYDEKRTVFAFELLSGFKIDKEKNIFELFFGLGYRKIIEERNITEWLSVHGYKDSPTSHPDLTYEEENKVYNTISIHFGINFTFPFKE